jgi:O-antigen ligase
MVAGRNGHLDISRRRGHSAEMTGQAPEMTVSGGRTPRPVAQGADSPKARRRPNGNLPTRQSMAQLGFTAALGLTVLFNGSITQPYAAIAQGGLVLAAVLALATVPSPSAPARAVIVRLLVCHTVLAGWVMIQIMPVPLPLAHDIWGVVADTIGTESPRISVHPGLTREALARAMMPGLAFITALWLSPSDRAARRLWQLLAGLGLVALAVAVGLEMQFPETELFSDYPVHRGTFSGFFVNRNVTAAYFMLVAFALSGVIALALADRAHHAAARRRQDTLFIGVAAVALFLVIIAVIATASRAGTLLGLSSLALGIGSTAALAWRAGRGGAGRAAGPGRGLAMIGIATVAAMAILMMFGEPVLSRLENTDESLRRCAWAAARQLIADNPLTGAGLGTFREVFPPVRDPDCFGTSGRLVRAHNSYLELYVGLGLPAAALLAYLLIEGLGLAAAGLRNRRRRRAIPVLLLAMSLYLALHALVDFPVQYPGIACYATALWGCGAAICLRTPEQRRRKRHRPPDPSRRQRRSPAAAVDGPADGR